ncbi:hypothetical protein [Niabella hirudinis]|uniref:hypothetical protein n=1 Tax=Niabella hirudinis TaxID=1285929 RepID=UPI003EC06697
MRFGFIYIIIAVLLTTGGCRTEEQDPYNYFARLQQLRLTIMSEYSVYAKQHKTAQGIHEKNDLQKEMAALMLRVEDSIHNCAFSRDDFGLKKAILHEVSYSMQLLADTMWARSRDTMLSVEERVKALDSVAAVVDRDTHLINKEIRKSQLAFASFYRVPVSTDQ